MLAILPSLHRMDLNEESSMYRAVLAFAGVVCIGVAVAQTRMQPVEPPAPTPTEVNGRIQAIVAQRDRATDESAILAGQVAELRHQLDQTRNKCKDDKKDSK